MNMLEPELRHIVGVYDDERDLVPAVSSFLARALGDHGAAIVIATPAHRAAFDAALEAGGLSPDALQRAGRYQSLDASDTLATFMRGDMPDPNAFASVFGSILGDVASVAGPVRLFGEMVALLWDAGNCSAAIALESLWNDLASEHSFALFCAYAMSSLETAGDLGAAKRMCDRHSSVVSLAGSRMAVFTEPGDGYDRMFVASPSSLRGVRQFVRETLRAWGQVDVNSDVEVIASELATNAVKHARSPFRVTISRVAGSSIRIAVRDASFDQPVSAGRDVGRVGGRGVQLVAALSRSWGTAVEVDGKTIWAEVSAGRAVEPV